MKRIQVIDFFSGCGGTSAGLRLSGMEILVGIDMDAEAAMTFRSNFPESDFVCRDIRNVLTWELERYLPRARVQPLLFSACAPCQPFSKQNRGKSPADQRAALLDELHRFIRRFRPEYIFLENVPGIQRINPADGPIGRFLRLLSELRYEVAYAVVDLLDYGVPQTRRRLVMTASLMGKFTLPEPTHGNVKGRLPHSTVWEWIGDLPAIEAGASHKEVPNHRAAALSPRNTQRIANTPEGGDRRDWPVHLILPCHEGHEGHTDVYGRLRWNRPASTLTTRCVSLSNGRFGHPTQNRALSLREAACLQTFPRDFIFEGSFNSMAMQIGNAVPVMLARRFGVAITEHARSVDKSVTA
ncbi:MAG TPA: DNA cytosine methyltransferase [Caulobacteraceae bacterium]